MMFRRGYGAAILAIVAASVTSSASAFSLKSEYLIVALFCLFPIRDEVLGVFEVWCHYFWPCEIPK